jgi:hypothetical protein
VQVFAIGAAMQLLRWRPDEGWDEGLPELITAAGNGLAAVATPDGRIHVFANAGGTIGILQYSFGAGANALPKGVPLPGSRDLQVSVLAAASAGGKIDVFAAGTKLAGVAEGTPLHWHFSGGTWSKRFLPGAVMRVGPNGGNGFAVIAPAVDRVELFGITVDGRMTHWSLGAQSTMKSPPALAVSFYSREQLPSGSWPALPDGVPAVVMTKSGELEVFAVGPGDPHGAALLHWRSRDAKWSPPIAHDGSFAHGGVAATTGAAFAYHAGSDGLQLCRIDIDQSEPTPEPTPEPEPEHDAEIPRSVLATKDALPTSTESAPQRSP